MEASRDRTGGCEISGGQFDKVCASYQWVPSLWGSRTDRTNPAGLELGAEGGAGKGKGELSGGDRFVRIQQTEH